MKTFGWVCLVALLLVGIVVLDKVFFVTNTVDNSVKGVISKTLDSDNVIQNYEWFKQTYADYNAAKSNTIITKKSLEQLKETPRSKMDWSDKQDLNKTQTTLDGQLIYVNQLAADYNAKSKMLNRSIFKKGDIELPQTLPLVTE